MITHTLNAVGQAALTAEIAARARTEYVNASAWFVTAEERADGGFPADIEVCRQYTASRQPELIRLDPDWFDVRVTEDEE